MTVERYLQLSAGKAEVLSCGTAKIAAGYAGDFLSHVMGGAPSGCIWFTVMSNINVAAVAHLCDCAVVVVCDGIKPDTALVERCAEQGINLVTTNLRVYEACAEYAMLEARSATHNEV